MCKLQRYRYACGHAVRYRLSSCRGTFHKPSTAERGQLPTCQAEYYIELSSTSICGPCQYERFNDEWRTRLDQARDAHAAAQAKYMAESGLWWDSSGSDESTGSAGQEEVDRLAGGLEELSLEFDRASWQVRSRFPTQWKEWYSRIECGSRVSNSSPLKQEVGVEDLLLEEEKQAALAHEEARKEKFTGYSTFQSFFLDKYGLWGPDLDLSAEAPVDDVSTSASTLMAYGPETCGSEDSGQLADIAEPSSITILAMGPNATESGNESDSALSCESVATSVSSKCSDCPHRPSKGEKDKRASRASVVVPLRSGKVKGGIVNSLGDNAKKPSKSDKQSKTRPIPTASNAQFGILTTSDRSADP